MEFALTEEQQELESFLHELLNQRSDSAAVRRVIKSDAPFDRELWAVLCEQIGVASLAIPEAYGGAGFTTRETHLVLEALGRSLTPSPYLGSVAITAQALTESGNAALCEALLPGIADGTHIGALAWADPAGQWAPERVAVKATAQGDSWTLSGEVPFVLDAGSADTVLAIAQTSDGPALFATTDTATLTRTAIPTLDQTLSLASVQFADTPAGLVTNDPGVLRRIRLHALTAISAMQLGTAARALDDTVEYAKQRVQFGRPIGSFQALKHRMADMLVALEQARTTSYAAAWAQAHNDPEWERLAVLAKTTANDALTLIAGEMIQLHGGIAITWEHDAHLIFKRAHATAQLFGTSATLRTERAHALLSASSER